jgi:hypothetical protein
MLHAAKLEIAKDLIETGKIHVFRDIFLYLPKTEMSKQLGINYSRFLGLIKNPRRLRYDEVYAMARILDVSARKISELVHNQLDTVRKDHYL